MIFDSDIGAVTDMSVQAAIEFLTADKVIVSREDVKDEKNKVILYLLIASTMYVDDLNCLPERILYLL